MMQSAHTATLVAKIPIVFFTMARSPIEGLKAFGCLQRSRADLTDLTVFAAAGFQMAKSKFH
jgi:hypothetical protein